MTEDPNRKSLRQFQCRDYLWDTFEQMSQDLECSVDYLINEAMRHYARSQGKLRQTISPGTVNRPPDAGPPQRAAPPMASPPRNAPPGPTAGGPGARAPGGPPPMGPNGVRPMQPPPGPAMSPGYAQTQQRQAPPMPAPPPGGYGQPQRVPQPPAFPNAGGGVLYAVFEGQKYPIVKDEFYIGRSNKSCDLIVKDPNVSRQHARIVRHQGQFWMVDMGSTNGIEFQGGRVDRRPIGEGDVFRICDHEIVFTYR
jgi:FHA domain